jgi:hypothetical protein
MKKMMILLMLVLFVSLSAYAAEIKVAVVAPAGSTWVNVLKE